MLNDYEKGLSLSLMTVWKLIIV